MTLTDVSSANDRDPPNYEEFIALEAMALIDQTPVSNPTFDKSRCFVERFQDSSMLQKLLYYPARDSLELKPTSWLDGVRGVAALEVFIFHAMGCWANIVPAWQSDEHQTNIMQFPIIRTFFVSGGASVCLFFVLSGYVLTHKSLRWIREGQKHQVYPSVASSMFRRGFRLYLPPILLMFCEMIATRFGFAPPLNFTFVPESTVFAQFLDWLGEINRFVNPFYTFQGGIQGTITHTKYDVVVWTIPLEFYGSFMCYFFLFLLVWTPSSGARMGLVAVFSIFCMFLGSWNMFCFSAGMLIADLNLGQEHNEKTPSPKHRIIWTTVFALALYLAGFPSLLTGVTPMPGYETLLSLIPTSLNMQDYARFWWSISGVSLLLSISQLPRLQRVFETNFCQYLGKIAFSLYLIHEFSIILFGLGIQRVLLDVLGSEEHAYTLRYWLICGVWYLFFTLPVFALAARVERWVDAPSVKFARWLEGECLKCYRKKI
ncbi:uncharacterized protein PAC_16254 [Phialocephala subalpina]|uniref:Acyltransferase 3 domain-containing protein n=1 Tax=Phialocephala subalpina TaxID=576137 RepID=A0A1L7XMU6_9HELO|nr:uncharacterized protein PAC_16254 [Phialocephala subalpina]